MFAADLALMFADDGHDVLVGGVPTRGLFDSQYAEILGISGSTPVFAVATAAVPNVARRQPVVFAEARSIAIVGSVAFDIADIQPDGAGLTRLILEKA